MWFLHVILLPFDLLCYRSLYCSGSGDLCGDLPNLSMLVNDSKVSDLCSHILVSKDDVPYFSK